MSDHLEPLTPEEERANQLYWNSDESVNSLVEQFNLSKSRLYDVIRPLPAGVACPDCGAALAFQHRTARDRGILTCAACEFEGEVDGSLEGEGWEDEPSDDALPPRTPARQADELSPFTLAAGGLLVGLAAGLLLGTRFRS